jgi:hypothetical protein
MAHVPWAMREVAGWMVLAAVVLGSGCEGAGMYRDKDNITQGDDGETEAGDGDGESVDGHGSIRIEVAALGGANEIFDGTTEVVATVHYEACLQEFYLDREPSFQQDGPDGEPVFADWATRLCSSFSDSPSCEVTSIEQSLLDANQVYTLKVTFAIEDASTIADREFHVGPLPLEELAGCDENVRPRVELQQSGLIGKNSEGAQIWRISTLPGSNVAVADQDAALRVEIIPVTP